MRSYFPAVFVSLLAVCYFHHAETASLMVSKFNQAKPAPRYTVDLDQDPYDRWQHIARNYNGTELSEWITASLEEILPNPGMIKPLMEMLVEDLDNYFTKPIADEMRGMSKALKIQLYEVVLVNIFYDFTAFNSSQSRVCTSIIAQDKLGNVLHGRNLDYQQPALMRDFTVQLNFTKNGSVVFRATTFIGYIGIITGVRPGAFSISGNERDTGYMIDNIFSALLGGKLDFMLSRQMLENVETYEEAFKQLSNSRIIAPVYYIIGGAKPGQGALIVRDPNEMVKTIQLGDQLDHPWFILETNYDPWKQPPASDNRRDPGIQAMKKVTQAEISPATMYQVLSGIPVMNDETVYTTIMGSNLDSYVTMTRYDAPPPKLYRQASGLYK